MTFNLPKSTMRERVAADLERLRLARHDQAIRELYCPNQYPSQVEFTTKDKPVNPLMKFYLNKMLETWNDER
jgi:hypothetical protein